ncbi:MAG TPA: CHASE3 domain-containing protein, partial [Candidatus Wunengus californicus]
MRIGQRLGLGFGIILLLTIGISTFIFLSLHRIHKSQKVVAIHISNIENVEELNLCIQRWLMTVEDILKKRALSQSDYHEILEATIENKLDEIDWNIYGDTIGNLHDEITQTFNSIKKLNNAVQMYIKLGSKVSEAINID